VMDITDENNPSIYGFNPVHFYSEEIDVYNNYCAVGGWVDMDGDTMKNGVGLVNISDPSTPIHINSINNGHDRIEMQLVDTFLHTISVAGVRTRYAIWDISDMGSAYIRDTLIGDFGAMHKLTIENDTTIFEYGSTEIEIYNSGNVDNIIQIDSIEKPSWSLFLKKYGGYLFEVDSYNNIKVWDISDIPNADTIARTYVKSELLDLLKTGDIIYTTHTKYGLSIFNFNPTGIENQRIYNKQDNITITTTFSSISINNQTKIAQQYQLMDITGRIINTIEAKSGITEFRPKKSGVYFIMNKDNLMKKKFVIIR
ncbi:hypothetical protein KAU15_00655, partial [candidate division WOR-3 bacterium]|nr:hypothetical protein [candidate division WOR-3 bacterium]